jgi:hypothetical protein
MASFRACEGDAGSHDADAYHGDSRFPSEPHRCNEAVVIHILVSIQYTIRNIMPAPFSKRCVASYAVDRYGLSILCLHVSSADEQNSNDQRCCAD